MALKTLEEKFDLLFNIKKSIPFLKDLSEGEITKIVKDLKFTKYNQDEIIVEQESLGEEIYIIVAGDCNVMFRQADSKDLQKKVKFVNVANLKKKDFFGEISIITKTPRTARVTAGSSGASIISLKLDLDNKQGVKELDSILVKVHRAFLYEVSTKLYEANKKLHDKTLFRLI